MLSNCEVSTFGKDVIKGEVQALDTLFPEFQSSCKTLYDIGIQGDSDLLQGKLEVNYYFFFFFFAF